MRRRTGLGGFDPSTYPGWRPGGAGLVHDGTLHDVEIGEHLRDVRTPIDAPILRDDVVHWSLAHGSNACPDRLVDKGMDAHGAILVPAVVRGWAPAFEARRSPGTGSVPVTLVPVPGRTTQAWILGIHPEAQQRMDASEGRGDRYHVGRVGPVDVAGRWRVPAVPAYGPVHDTVVLAHGDVPATWPDVDQDWAARALDAGAPTVTVPPLPDVVPGNWPTVVAHPLERSGTSRGRTLG